MLQVFLRCVGECCITDISFCVQILLHIEFFRLDICFQTFHKSKRNLNSPLASGKRIIYIYFQHSLEHFVVTNPTSPKAVSYQFSYV